MRNLQTEVAMDLTDSLLKPPIPKSVRPPLRSIAMRWGVQRFASDCEVL